MTKREDGGDTDLQMTETGDVIGTGGGDRLAILERIADQADTIKASADELVDVVSIEGDETAPFVPGADSALPVSSDEGDQAIVDKELSRAAEEVNPESPPPSEVAPPPAPAPDKHRIKVNGREYDLTTAELIARAQKVESADVYLEEAAKVRREAQNKTPPAPSAEELDATEREEALRLARALQMGSEQEAVDAIREIRRASRPQGLDAATVARVTDDRLIFRQAADWFNSEYADVMGDPLLKKLALDRDTELTKAGDTRPYRERYKEIGDGLRGWTAKFKGEATSVAEIPAPATSLETRRAAKAAAALKSAPPAAATKAPTGETQDKPESPQDIIADMAKRRGGNQFMR